jgi:DNA primase
MTEKSTLSVILENCTSRLFRNVSRNGDWINFSCPIAPFSPEHKYKEDKSPSCGTIVTDLGSTYVKCYTCKYQGSFPNLLRYLQTKKNVDYSEIINKLESEIELPEYEDLLKVKEKKPHDPLPFQFNIYEDVDSSTECMKYLLNRGVSVQTAKKLGLGYHPEGQRVTFPVKGAKGEVYGYTARTILADGHPKILDYYFPKSRFILGVEHWNPEYPVLIVEGLFAFAHIHEISKGKYFPYNIGAIMGSSISDDQTEILLNFGKPVYCLLDNDIAGKSGMYGRKPMPDWSETKKAMERSKGMVHKLKDHLPTHTLKWPEGKDDPDQLTLDELYDMLLSSRLVIS